MGAAIRAVVISLAGSARRAQVTETLEPVGLPWSFFDACTGAGVHPYHRGRALRAWGRPLTPGEVGCAASHLAVIDEISRDPAWSWTLVLEDDVILDPMFDIRAAVALCDELGVDYLRLYARCMAPSRELAWIDQRQLVRFRRSPMGSQAYLMSRGAAARASARIGEIVRPIDVELDRYWSSGLPNYALFPFPLLELSSKSTIAKLPDGAEAGVADRLFRLGFRAHDYVLRAISDLSLLRRDAVVRRRIAAANGR